MKKILCITLVIGILSSLAPAVFAADRNLSISIAEAQNIAMTNSKQASVDDLDIKTKQSAVDEAKIDDFFVDSGSSLENQYKQNVDPINVETNLEMAKKTKQKNTDTLKFNVYKAALDILLAGKNLDTENQKLSSAQEKYKMVEAQYNLGKVTINDLNDAEYRVEGKKIDVSNAQDKLTAAYLDFKKLLNLPLDAKPVTITDDLAKAEWKDLDIDKTVADVMIINATVYQKNQNVKMREKAFEDVAHFTREGNSGYNSAMYDLDAAKMELNDSKAKLETDIRNKYNELLNQKDSAELAVKFEAIAAKSFKSAQTKYDTGMISKDQFLSEKEKYLDAVYQRYSAVHNYNIAKVEFENMLK